MASWLLIPVLGTLLLLTLAAWSLRSDPTTSVRLYHALIPSAPRVAPTDLRVEKLEFRDVALDSGDTLPVISGTISNRGTDSFHDVLLEAMLFDERGKLLARTRVNAGSTLAKARLRALSLEMVRNLQSATDAPGFTLRPGDSQDVVIGFPESNVADATFFSVRVVSVRLAE